MRTISKSTKAVLEFGIPLTRKRTAEEMQQALDLTGCVLIRDGEPSQAVEGVTVEKALLPSTNWPGEANEVWVARKDSMDERMMYEIHGPN